MNKTRTISSPEDICAYLHCPREKVYFRRAWAMSAESPGLRRFDRWLEKGFAKSFQGGRSRATYRLPCRGPDKGAPLIDGIIFGSFHGVKLVVSVGPLDPLYYGDTTTVFDILARQEDKGMVDRLFQRFFSEDALKGSVQKVSQYGGTSEVRLFKAMSLEDVVLPAETKRLVVENTLGLLEKRAAYRKNGIPLKRGLLFVGPPGNGKTMVCRALARTRRFTTYWVTPAEHRELHTLYEKAAKTAPSLVLFEDIDLLGSNRSEGRHILGDLLNAMDGLAEAEGVVTIATTNEPAALDKALANRPNRFDLRIDFPNPVLEQRLKMLKSFTGRQTLAPSLDLGAWARRTEGLSGAQLRELCLLAARRALESGRMEKDLRAHLEEGDLAAGWDAMRASLEHRGRLGFKAVE